MVQTMPSVQRQWCRPALPRARGQQACGSGGSLLDGAPPRVPRPPCLGPRLLRRPRRAAPAAPARCAAPAYRAASTTDAAAVALAPGLVADGHPPQLAYEQAGSESASKQVSEDPTQLACGGLGGERVWASARE